MERVRFSKSKVWFVFVMLFICGAFVGVGIANWGHSVKIKQNIEPVNQIQDVEKSCQAIERVLLDRLHNNDNDCDDVRADFNTYKQLVTYGCEENHDSFVRMAENKNAILEVACNNYNNVQSETKSEFPSDDTCAQIEESLRARLPWVNVESTAEEHINRAKIYAVMAERGCPGNSAKYTELAKQELDVARGINDDKFSEDDTIEVVETYKRLKMQQDAEEIFNKAKKLTNPAIDFIMQVEKIINE